jgi:hypothetical protein
MIAEIREDWKFCDRTANLNERQYIKVSTSKIPQQRFGIGHPKTKA